MSIQTPVETSLSHEDAPSASFARRHAYALVSIAVIVATAGWTFNERWSSPDFWVHLAAVREFAHEPVAPGHPLVIGSEADPYMSPYAWLLGIAARVTGASAITILAVVGALNLVLLLYALHRFARMLSMRQWAPPLLLVFTLTAWGVSPWRWSGFFELNSLGAVLPLSSTAASALGLLAIVAARRWLRGASAWYALAAGVAAALVVLCHPMTGVWIGAIGAAFVLFDASRNDLNRLLVLAGAFVVAAILAAVWPFFPVGRLVQESDVFNSSNEAMYEGVAERTFLALPGFVILAFRARNRLRDPLVLGALFTLGIYVAGFVFDRHALGRVLPGIMLMAHAAMAVWLADLLARWDTLERATKGLARSGFVLLVVVGLLGCLPGIVRMVPRDLLPGRYANDARLASLVAPYEPLRGLIERNDVVVASPQLALGVAAMSGKAIAPPAPAPFVDDIDQRRAVESRLLSPATQRAEYLRLVETYGVEWIVVSPADARALRRASALGELLDVRATTSDFVILQVRREGSS